MRFFEILAKMQRSADKVESKEHGQTKNGVVGNPSRSDGVADVIRPEKIWFARNWMNGANEQLETDLEYPLPCHGDPPIIYAILYEKYLRGK